MKLEPDLHEPYKAWQTTPTPQTTGALLRAVSPHMDKAIQANVGENNPLLRSRAKKMVLGALNRYDPKQASMGTFLRSQLQGMRRVQRDQLNPIHVPERMALEQGQMVNAESELEANFGRAPSTAELADHMGISPKKLAKLRQLSGGVPEGYFQSHTESENNPGGYLPPVMQQRRNMVADLVYGDLTSRDQVIMEHSLGMNGNPVLQNQQIASKLGVSPGFVSQRKAYIQSLLDHAEDLPL